LLNALNAPDRTHERRAPALADPAPDHENHGRARRKLDGDDGGIEGEKGRYSLGRERTIAD